LSLIQIVDVSGEAFKGQMAGVQQKRWGGEEVVRRWRAERVNWWRGEGVGAWQASRRTVCHPPTTFLPRHVLPTSCRSNIHPAAPRATCPATTSPNGVWLLWGSCLLPSSGGSRLDKRTHE